MKLRSLYSMIYDEEWLNLLINIESGRILESITILRYYTGGDLITGAKVIKQIAKEELSKDILTFIEL